MTARALTAAFLMAFIVASATVPAAEAAASLSVSPRLFNARQCESIGGKMLISSGVPGTFEISITGVPEDWLEYQASVHVDGEGSVNFLVSPQKSGDYRLVFSATGPGGTVSSEKRLWVSRERAGIAAGEPAVQAGGIAPASGGLTGMSVAGDQGAGLIASVGIVIAAIVALVLGFRFIRRDSGPQPIVR